VRRSPVHAQLLAHGAVVGGARGRERANRFAETGQERAYRYSRGRQTWFVNAAAEHRAVRGNVGMSDMSSLGKLRVEGPDAESVLNHVCGGNMAVPAGKTVYTRFLNPRGGIEADVTVTRLADQTRLRRHAGVRRVVITDMTTAEGVLAVMGPPLASSCKLSRPPTSPTRPTPSARHRISRLARAHRVSCVGELCREIYVSADSADMAAHVFETLAESGQDVGLKLCGMRMMDSCRVEKAFRHFGHDIACEDSVVDVTGTRAPARASLTPLHDPGRRG
jgi:4-methylaminobutanoate oxidase (formaldehyde-forming)